MKIDLVAATSQDQETIQNLGRFYVYEISRYCGHLPGWEAPANGLFECIDLSRYWKPDHYPFLIKVDNEIGGFALIDKRGSSPDVDWNMGEFFVISKFQGKGIGRLIAEQIFNQFPGVWEVGQIPANKGAIDFWEKVIGNYSNGDFQVTQKTIAEPKPHPMNILKFRSPSMQTHEDKIYYKEHASVDEEAVLLEGIIHEAVAKGRSRLRPFVFLMKDAHNTILAGAKGTTLYGSLYVDLLWVTPEFRHKSWGTQLIHACEKLGLERGCTFACLTTFDWEALPFYQKLGYQIEFVREGYEKNSKMYVLKKDLLHN